MNTTEVKNALVEFKYQEVSHAELANYVGFTNKETNMLKIFWEPAFNRSWFYLYPEFITDELGYKSVKKFYVDVLHKKYIEGIDYQQIDKNDKLVKNFYGGNFPLRKKPGNRALYYKITGKTLKLILMRATTKIALETHEYYIKVEELVIFMKDYIQELHKELHLQQLETQNKLLLESKEQIDDRERKLKEKETELQKEKEKSLKLTKFIEDTTPKEKNQIFYIVCTKQQALENRFKFGGVKDRSLLASNLTVYNRGMAEGNKHYYAYIINCYDFKAIETVIKSSMPFNFKDNHNLRCETVNCHYIVFKEIVNLAVDGVNHFTTRVNNLINKMIHYNLYEKAVVPESLVFERKARITLFENGEEKDSRMINLDNLPEDDRVKILTDILKLYDSNTVNKRIIKRKDIENELSKEYIFKKRYLWKQLKDICENFNKLVLKYR